MFGSKFYRQVVGIPIGSNCDSLVADLCWVCYERDFLLSVTEVFISTSYIYI